MPSLLDPLGLLAPVYIAGKLCCSASGEQGRSEMSHYPRNCQDEFRHGGEMHSSLEMLFLSSGGLERHKT